MLFRSPPDPADRVSGWPEPESTARMQRPDAPEATTRIDPPAVPRDPASPRTEQPAPAREPAPTQPPARPEPPASAQSASTGQSAPTSRDQWSNVTQSTSETDRPYTEPPNETTLPRAPQPTAELPPPGSPPASTGRLPLPEERESDES